MSSRPLPTDAELEILTALWARGCATVREVQQALPREAGYTTVLKLMQIMHAKGLVRRDESERTHVYEAAFRREDTERGLVGDLARRAFGGSAGRLVMRALSERTASPEEIAEIRRLLDEAERGR
ncbi:MAG TPA: BlaI/MecI/CopY family transcriptional regulator [Longimicrobium sp.]|jgi:predicted transcriptional regulator|uniref:BlaI/MecI/CopY family transcriptional regulator n=1 Tax=Longimicrobium sp. TaxID=2029185 RepID=UPI002ED97334